MQKFKQNEKIVSQLKQKNNIKISLLEGVQISVLLFYDWFYYIKFIL